MIKQIALCTLAAAVMLTAAYVGISRDLCRRDNLAPADYAEMKLDCTLWIYR